MDRASAARLAGMDRQTLRDWVHRYNEEGICNGASGRFGLKLAENEKRPINS
jgi:transposase-like protein